MYLPNSLASPGPFQFQIFETETLIALSEHWLQQALGGQALTVEPMSERPVSAPEIVTGPAQSTMECSKATKFQSTIFVRGLAPEMDEGAAVLESENTKPLV